MPETLNNYIIKSYSFIRHADQDCIIFKYAGKIITRIYYTTTRPIVSVLTPIILQTPNKNVFFKQYHFFPGTDILISLFPNNVNSRRVIFSPLFEQEDKGKKSCSFS